MTIQREQNRIIRNEIRLYSSYRESPAREKRLLPSTVLPYLLYAQKGKISSKDI